MKMDLVEQLRKERNLTDEELREMIDSVAYDEPLRCAADEVRREHYGDAVFLRGLIEFTNDCKNNCYYCGIRAGNTNAARYRLTKDEILDCCAEGYALGRRHALCARIGKDRHGYRRAARDGSARSGYEGTQGESRPRRQGYGHRGAP